MEKESAGMSERAARGLWEAIGRCEWGRLSDYFTAGAVVEWPNTRERFDVDGFVRVNRDYPGRWDVELERAEGLGPLVVTVARVWSGADEFRAVSFFEFAGEKIARLVEYWGDVAPAPEWRREFDAPGAAPE